jgi:hypothetical protein
LNTQTKISALIITLILFTSIELNAHNRIAVLYSDYSQKTFFTNTNSYLDEFTAWEIFLMQYKINYKVIYDEDLVTGLEDDFDILVLPRYNVQSIEKYLVIKNFLLAGKSILSANAFNSALMNSNTNELKDLFGIMLKNQVLNKRLGFTQTIFQSPINSFKNYSDFLVAVKSENQCVDLGRYNYSTAGYILNADNNSEISSIVYGKNNSGKFVFIGFGLTDLIGGSEEYHNFEQFLLDSIKWLDIEVSAFPYLTINKKEQIKLLLMQYNNAFNKDFADVLILNSFNPHIVISEISQLDKSLLNKVPEEQIILDLRSTIQYNKNNSNIIDYLRSFESLNNITVQSVFISSDFDPSQITQLKEYGIKNFILFNEKVSGTQLTNDGSLFLTVGSASRTYFNEPVEVVYYIPKIDCNTDVENNFLKDLKNKVNDRTVFTNLTVLRNKLNLEREIKVSVQNNQSIEITVRNDNPVELKDIILYVNINDFNVVSDKRKSFLNYSVDSGNGMKKIFINEILPRSEEKIIFNSGR